MKRQFKYRFKTEKEFIEEFGGRWRNVNEDTSFISDMDYLLGSDIDKRYYDDILIGRKFIIRHNGRDHRYGILPLMYKKIDLLPSYRPKKFIKD